MKKETESREARVRSTTNRKLAQS